MSLPGIIYHYTDQDALLSIVDTGTLYFTDSMCLNDSTDGSYIAELYTKAAARVREERQWSATALKAIDEIPRRVQRDVRFYVACFSNCENLNQWAHYCNGRQGYSIGFDRETLFNAVCNLLKIDPSRPDGLRAGAWQGNVVYDLPQEERDRFEQHIRMEAERFREYAYATEDEKRRFAEALMLHTDKFVEQMREPRISKFKHHAFDCEKEFRIAFRLESWPDGQVDPVEGGLEARHKSGKSFLKPTVVAGFGREGLAALIKEIWVGPGPSMKLAAAKLESFLRSRDGYKQRLSRRQLLIKESTIPLRTW